MEPDALFVSVVEKYAEYLNPYLGKLMAFAGFGVEMKGEGCYVYDQEGRKFLDCLGGYGTFALGHRHPVVVQAVKDQLDTIALGAKAFFSANGADLAEQLASLAPDGIQYSFFCNSGTEAVECALKFARLHTGRQKFVSTHDGFHGKTLGALSVMGREKYRKPFEPLLGPVDFIPYGSIEALSAIDDQTAAFIVEPIQGEAGIIIPPDGYLKAAREACDRVGALLIFDEVQTGFGRTGYVFGADHEGVSPDLMTLAKAIGGGIMPLGVCMGRREIWDSVYSANPLSHTSTFGGNPLACAAGLAALRVLKDENLVVRSARLGERLKLGLVDVGVRHPDMIKEVRGRGLMVGLEFQMDEVGELVVAQLLKRGVCVAYALNNPRVLRFEPPLVITEAEIDFAVNAVDDSLVETGELLASLV